MNCTNYTIEKPVCICKQSSSGSGRDQYNEYLIISSLQLFLSTLQIVVAVAIACWVNGKIRRKDRKKEERDKNADRERKERERAERLEKEERDKIADRERKKRERAERLEKEERDKIADIINNEINKIVGAGIDEDLRKCKAKFQDMVMFYGSEEIMTGLDVLRYMLLKSNDFKSEPLGKLQEDLDAVVRLFRTLRIKLRLYLEGDHACPENTKKELGPLVADVGEIARSFLLGSELNTISSVLKYFGSVHEEVRSNENEENEDGDHISKIRRIFPYINGLLFGEIHLMTDLDRALPTSNVNQDFSFDISKAIRNPIQNEITSYLEEIEFQLRNKKRTIRAEVLRSFAVKIDAIWEQNFSHQLPIPDWRKEEHLRDNILHAVRVFMFKVAKGSDIINDATFKELVDEMKNTIYVQDDSDEHRKKINSTIEKIKRFANSLPSPPQLAQIDSELERVSHNISLLRIQAPNEQ